MPKRVDRPWENRGIGRGTFSNYCNSTNHTSSKKQSHTSSTTTTSNSSIVPSITVNGITYYSDRFYLHRPKPKQTRTRTTKQEGINATMRQQEQQPKKEMKNHHYSCTCGSRQPPPLLDRGELIRSLDLKAAIVSTYTMDPYWMKDEFSSLFQSNSNDTGDENNDSSSSSSSNSIPTLVLHGHKGFSIVPQKEHDEKEEVVSSNPDSTNHNNKYAYDSDPNKNDSFSEQHRQRQVDATKSCSDTPPIQIKSDTSTTFHRIESLNGNDIICIDDSSDEDGDNKDKDEQLESSTTTTQKNKHTEEQQEKQKRNETTRTSSLEKVTLDQRSTPPSCNSVSPIIPDAIKSRHSHNIMKDKMVKEDTNLRVQTKEDLPPEESWRTMQSPTMMRQEVNLQFPKSVHFTEVLPTYLPLEAIRKRPKDSERNLQCTGQNNNKENNIIVTVDDMDDDSSSHANKQIQQQDQQKQLSPKFQGIHPYVVQNRKYMKGVHHPKFMILFEKQGSIVVVVSTGNLTNPGSTDASWIQRFEPSTNNATSTSTPPLKVSEDMRCNGSDFGYVLADYLQRQSDATKDETHVMPTEFLQHYLQINTLTDFRRRYKFEQSQVHLIATVPGQHRGRHSSKHLGRLGGGKKLRSFLYGPQRVADILSRLGEKGQPHQKANNDESRNSNNSNKENGKTLSTEWLPDSILSNQDRLVIQQTSLGGNWKRANLAELGRSYFACDDLQQNATSNINKDDELLERMDILWPTEEFMKNHAPSASSVVGHLNPEKSLTTSWSSISRDSPNMVSDVERLANYHTAISTNHSQEMIDSGLHNGSLLFLSSKAFNTIDLSCISRMTHYEPSIPEQIPEVRPPHIKTYSRMFEGNEYNLRQTYNCGKADEFFSWVLMSSACLSLGAQGKAVPHRGFESDEMTYSNFELGIMFCSRLQRNPSHDRLYCWKPTQCVCGRRRSTSKQGGGAGASLIHLPFPFCLRPPSYQDDPDEANFSVTPFFHEVPQGTGSVGQMVLTPLGSALASARD